MLTVTSVTILGGYRLGVSFNDGVAREIDLADELHGPMFEPLRDPAYFAQAFIDHDAHTVAWPNGLDLDPNVLHGDHPAAAPLASPGARTAG